MFCKNLGVVLFALLLNVRRSLLTQCIFLKSTTNKCVYKIHYTQSMLNYKDMQMQSFTMKRDSICSLVSSYSSQIRLHVSRASKPCLSVRHQGKENQGFSPFCFAHFLCDTGIEPKVACMLGECSIIIDFLIHKIEVFRGIRVH